MSPLETLLNIEQNCRSYAASIPKQIVTEKDWLGIAFRSTNLNFVCPMRIISEVLHRVEITPVPAGQAWFRGVTNLRGRLLPVTDLQGFITGVPHRITPLSRILVVSSEKMTFGFAVEQVLGIEQFFGEEIKPANNVLSVKEYLPYLEGVFEREHHPWFVLNFALIPKVPEFYHILSVRIGTENG